MAKFARPTRRVGWPGSWRASIGYVLLCSAAVLAVDFVVQLVVSADLSEALRRCTRAMPFVLLAAMAVLVPLRREVLARHRAAADLWRANRALVSIAKLSDPSAAA